LTYVASGL